MTARGEENAQPPVNREDLEARVFESGVGERNPVDAADLEQVVVKKDLVKRRDSAQLNECSVKSEKRQPPVYDRDLCNHQLFLSAIQDECSLCKTRVWAAVAAILEKVYVKLTIQVHSRVPAKEGAQKWNVVLVAYKDMEHLASYRSLAQGAGLVNSREPVAQRGMAM